MPPAATVTVPPAYAWDWVGRQRLVWVEARRRLAPAAEAATAKATADDARRADVPDWSDLLDRGPVRRPTPPVGSPTDAPARPDWSALATRAEVMAALRAGYPSDPDVRSAVDGAVADVAFLGRRGGDLSDLGVRTPPRGLRWWWGHLGGRMAPDPATSDPQPAGVQLTLADVMTG